MRSLADPRYNFTIHAFGCKVNTYDTGLIQSRLERAGYAHDPSRPSIHVLNSCAVTSEATREAIKLARRLKARDPLATVVMTGCAAQVDGPVVDHAPGIDLVVANSHKGVLGEILDRYFRRDPNLGRVFRSNIFRKEDLEAGGGIEAGHTRAFLKIQDGCNSFCSFCVIPYARGKSRSIPIDVLVARVRDLHQSGVNEVVLTGVHIGDYVDSPDSGVPQSIGARHAGKRDLAALVRSILEMTHIPRLRLTSLEPIELSEPLMELFTDERLCPHFHMSIQSAQSRVLRAMKRRYEREAVEQALGMIKERVPGAFVGMDVIVGFPGETDEEFEETFRVLEASPWTRLHVFPYSERPGTKAALLEGAVALPTRARRASRLRELSAERYAVEALKQVDTVKKVLILKNPAHGASSLSRDYWPVQISLDGDASKAPVVPGEEIEVRITGYDHSSRSRMDGSLLARRRSVADGD